MWWIIQIALPTHENLKSLAPKLKSPCQSKEMILIHCDGLRLSFTITQKSKYLDNITGERKATKNGLSIYFCYFELLCEPLLNSSILGKVPHPRIMLHKFVYFRIAINASMQTKVRMHFHSLALKLCRNFLLSQTSWLRWVPTGLNIFSDFIRGNALQI